jgi:hypothetical protein
VILAFICFKIRQECDCLSIHELNACQIENHGLTIALRYPFQFRQILGLDTTTSPRTDVSMRIIDRHGRYVDFIAQRKCQSQPVDISIILRWQSGNRS